RSSTVKLFQKPGENPHDAPSCLVRDRSAASGSTLEPLRTSLLLPSYPALRLHRSSFSVITLSATKGHTLFLNAPWTEHDCRGTCFRCNSPLVTIPYESRQSKGCMARNVARRRTAARSPCGNRKKAQSRRETHWRFAAPPSSSGAIRGRYVVRASGRTHRFQHDPRRLHLE